MKNRSPSVIIVGMSVTGIACARALYRHKLPVYGVSFNQGDISRSSSTCKIIEAEHLPDHESSLCELLRNIVSKMDEPPIIIATSDIFALAIAKEYDSIASVAKIWSNNHEALVNIISKDRLYRLAQTAGIETIPHIISPTLTDLRKWVELNECPYVVKPFYEGDPDNNFPYKNKVFDNSRDLIQFLDRREGGSKRLIIQRVIKGGDGMIFDCYGYADRNYHLHCTTSHRRIYQWQPNWGITCYGEIPAQIPVQASAYIKKASESLLKVLPYHGIFGIEWLMERTSKRIYLVDFNARPFYTIGHLNDCGLNLPFLAYLDLCGEDLTSLAAPAEVTYKKWIDFWPCLAHFIRLRSENKTNWHQFIREVISAKSYAIWDLSDPVPSIRKAIQIIKNAKANYQSVKR